MGKQVVEEEGGRKGKKSMLTFVQMSPSASVTGVSKRLLIHVIYVSLVYCSGFNGIKIKYLLLVPQGAPLYWMNDIPVLPGELSCSPFCG